VPGQAQSRPWPALTDHKVERGKPGVSAETRHRRSRRNAPPAFPQKRSGTRAAGAGGRGRRPEIQWTAGVRPAYRLC